MKLLTAIALTAFSANPAIGVAGQQQNIENINDKNELKYYITHKYELDSLLKNDFKLLGAEYLSNKVAKDWTHQQDLKFEMNAMIAVEQIDQLNINHNLKLFLLQNYLDKLSYRQMAREANQKNDDEEVVNAQTQVSSSVERPLSRQRRSMTPSWTPREVGGPKHYPRYTLQSINIDDAPSWDIGESKGEIDPISGRYFSQQLQYLSDQHGTRWTNDADSNFKSYKITFSIIDRLTGRYDRLVLLYNAAQDTDGDNEDFSFCAIEAYSNENIGYDSFGQKVPTVFGKPISFNEIQLHTIGADIESSYIISGHDEDPGSDNEWGNYLDGVGDLYGVNGYVPIEMGEWSKETGIDLEPEDLIRFKSDRLQAPGREAGRSLRWVARDVYNQMDHLLNDEYTQQENTNYLSYSDSKGHYFIDGDTTAPGVQKMHYNGMDDKTEEYYVFDSDTTYFKFSNQHVFDDAYTMFWEKARPYIEQLNRELETRDRVAQVGGAANVLSTTIQNSLKQIVDLSKELKFSSLGLATGSLLSKILTLGNIDWSSKDSVVTTLGTMGVSIVAGSIATNILTSALSSAFGLSSVVAGALGGFLVSAIPLILNFIPSGNGHSIMSNFNDHGLNDWSYQWNNNKENMIRTEVSYSRNFRNGIIWKVVDKWNLEPELFIKGQDQGSFTNLSTGNYDFNYGSKMGFRERQ